MNSLKGQKMGLFWTDYQIHGRIFSHGVDIGEFRLAELSKGHLVSWRQIADRMLYDVMEKHPDKNITEIRITRVQRLGLFPKNMFVDIYSTTPLRHSDIVIRA